MLLRFDRHLLLAEARSREKLMATTSAGNQTAIYEQLDEYNWKADQSFEDGLKTILASATTLEQITYLTHRAKCFYYAR